ncbi:MAG: LptA/OstA family protein [Elusimicrobiaceae bacterium]|nr:LptA/OstA family protein [Elusimicrobiaceae bacterium]
MKLSSVYLPLLLGTVLFTSACHTVRVEGPALPSTTPAHKLQQVKKNFTPKKLAKNELPPVLGGLVQSDSWIIYQDKKQEEFKGHVSYENDAYVFRADYALSDRAHSTFQAKGNVFLRQQQPDGSFYEAEAHQAYYDYQKQKGNLTWDGTTRVLLRQQDEKGQPAIARARRVTFDLNQRTYVLQGDVHIQRPSLRGTQTITAQKATFKQLQDYIQLEGNATVTDEQRTLQANTIIYDGQNNSSQAYGDRPVLSGSSPQGTFAIIADKVQSDSTGSLITLDGKVQGWVVSPRINESKVNKKF